MAGWPGVAGALCAIRPALAAFVRHQRRVDAMAGQGVKRRADLAQFPGRGATGSRGARRGGGHCSGPDPIPGRAQALAVFRSLYARAAIDRRRAEGGRRGGVGKTRHPGPGRGAHAQRHSRLLAQQLPGAESARCADGARSPAIIADPAGPICGGRRGTTRAADGRARIR
ncbi:hypothetical protein D3C76_1270560 [compost metagenome]